MEVKIGEGGEIILKHKLQKNETYKTFDSGKFKGISIYKKPQLVKGFSNVCEDGKGILVVDYDRVDISIVEEDYLLIQGLYGLPQAYLFKTSDHNYHIICLKKFYLKEIHDILEKTRSDINFKSMCLRNPFRSYILRLSDKKGSKKPKFVKLLGKKQNNWGEYSSAHQELIHKIYPQIPYPLSKGKPDNLKEVRFHVYET